MRNSTNSRLAAGLRSGGAPRKDCPTADRIWSAVRIELPLDERLAIIDHVGECPICAQAWSIASELADPRQAGRRDVVVAFLLRHALPLATAAAVVLAIGLSLLYLRPDQSGEPVFRGVRPLIPANASLSRDDFTLSWTGPPGSTYDVRVSTTDLKVIVDARDLQATQYRVSPERLAGLPTGTQLLWRVDAHTPEGTTVSSDTFEVSVR